MVFHSGFSAERKDKNYRKEFRGKYRAIVTNNLDPEKRGRVKVNCPKIFGEFESTWCIPCLPLGVTFMPKVGQGVWIEFEDGDPRLPIWVGIWFAEGECPNEVYKNDEVGFHHIIMRLGLYMEIDEKLKKVTIGSSGELEIKATENLILKGKEIHEN